MKFRSIFPLNDTAEEFNFQNCLHHEDFINEVVRIYFISSDLRVKESALAVYMAYRDHYPTYLKLLSAAQIEKLDSEIELHFNRIIKLRRIALSALAKVA